MDNLLGRVEKAFIKTRKGRHDNYIQSILNYRNIAKGLKLEYIDVLFRDNLSLKSIMKKKKLDSNHIFLQFLMMLLTLSFLLIFSLFIKNIFWFEKVKTTIPIISGIIVIFLSGISLLRYLLRFQEREFLFLAIFLFLLSFLTIFSTHSGSLSFSTQIIISITLIPLLFFLFLLIFLKKNWYYSNLDFWIIFSLSLFIFSRIFFFQTLLKRDIGFVEYSYIITLFGYLALTIGLVNEVYEVKGGQKGAKKRKKK